MEKLLVKRPEYDYLYIHIGKNLGIEGSIERARPYFETYLKRHPDSFYGLIAYGDLLYDSKQDKKALKMYQKVLHVGDYVNAVMYAGDALFHLGRYQESAAYYERGLRLLNEIGYRSQRDFPESARNMEIIKSGRYK